jgi:hypothetical protein
MVSEPNLSATVIAERPEIELLLCCARTRTDPTSADRLRALLREEIDWAYLLQTANRHRVAPLLYWNLNAACPEVVPTNVLHQLREHFYANNMRNLFLIGELLKLLNIFEAQGIPVIPYKGPTLAASVYGNVALREFGDLDILVHKHDLPRARQQLISLGYWLADRLTESQEAAFLASQREYVFVHDDNGSVVELHWAVAPRSYSFPLDPEHLWTRLRKLPLGGSTVLSFSPEDLLLILCAHGSKHFWHRLSWVCDIAELVRLCNTMDWEQLMTRASEVGAKRMLFLGLFLASELLAAQLPERIVREVRTDLKTRALARQVQEWLFQEGNGHSGILAKGQLEESRFHPFRVKVRERLRDKIRYCAYTALAPTVEDWNFIVLPKPFSPFYYVLRPVRLAGRYGQRLFEEVLR